MPKWYRGVPREGFWYSKEEPFFPHPVPNIGPWEGEAEFLAALAVVEKHGRGIGYMGYSECRVCGCLNGTREYFDRQGRFMWPEGFKHYVRDHHVKPSDAFISYIFEMARSYAS